MNDATFASNAIRLGAREWLWAVLLAGSILGLLPRSWRMAEVFEPGSDYRIPFSLSHDYWTYERWLVATSHPETIRILGDSVIWGEYTRPSGTLSAHLNRLCDTNMFVNGGLNGSHPLALEGLARLHCQHLQGRKLILHSNLLWLSSPGRDLADVDNNISFNHPRLIPQFRPRVPAYQASVEQRVGVLVDHYLPYRRWVHHQRIQNFDSLDIHSWSLDHPYKNPLSQISIELPAPSGKSRHVRPGEMAPPNWRKAGGVQLDFDWISLESSLQWHATLRTIKQLHQARNSLLVIVGPFNTHMLTPESQTRFRQLKQSVASQLSVLPEVDVIMPEVLPSEHYGDASHPLSAGYATLAAQLLADVRFQKWLAK